MKTIIAVLLLSAFVWAVDPPKTADAPKPEVKFTPELQNKLKTVLLQEYQIELKIKNLDDQYRQLSQQFQNELKQTQAKGQKLQEDTLKQLELDPKTHNIFLDANGDLSITDNTPSK